MIPGIRSTLAGLILGAGGKAVHLAEVATVAAAGTNQSNAAPLTATVNKVTGADGTKGVRLPAPKRAGQIIIVYNAGTVNLHIYPHSGGSIAAGAANAPVTLPSILTSIFVAVSTTEWAASTLG
jgi:hypothetical protein